MSISSERQAWEACFLQVQPGDCRACHSLAAARKVGVVESEAYFSTCLTAEGSSCFRASCHFSRASARSILGNGPRLRVFSRPLTRYLPRQSLPPVCSDEEVQAVAVVELLGACRRPSRF